MKVVFSSKNPRRGEISGWLLGGAIVQHVPGTLSIFFIQHGDLNKMRGRRVQLILLATVYIFLLYFCSTSLSLYPFFYYIRHVRYKETNVGVDSVTKSEE